MTNGRQKGKVGERECVVVLPYPPTVNTYWRQFRGRTLLSAKGRAYREAVHAACMGQAVKPVDGRLAVHIVAWMPDNRVRDVDNITKACLDGLAHARVYEDDGQIDDLRITRAGVEKANPRVEVSITRLSALVAGSSNTGANQCATQ